MDERARGAAEERQRAKELWERIEVYAHKPWNVNDPGFAVDRILSFAADAVARAVKPYVCAQEMFCSDTGHDSACPLRAIGDRMIQAQEKTLESPLVAAGYIAVVAELVRTYASYGATSRANVVQAVAQAIERAKQLSCGHRDDEWMTVFREQAEEIVKLTAQVEHKQAMWDEESKLLHEMWTLVNEKDEEIARLRNGVHRCPVCAGAQTVQSSLYTGLAVDTTTVRREPCRTCAGTGVMELAQATLVEREPDLGPKWFRRGAAS